MQPAICASDRNHPRTSCSAPAPLLCPDDENLLGRCRQGDRSAFARLQRRLERYVYRRAYRLSGNYDDAQDITAETFLRIYQAIPGLKHAVTLTAWVNRIIINVFHDMLRHARRRPAVSLDALIEKAGDAPLALETYHAASPQQQVEEEERRCILYNAIAALPAQRRRMLLLFHAENRTYEEIARMMKIPVGTVKSRLNRTRLALARALRSQLSSLEE